MWLLGLTNLYVPLGCLTCAVAPPRLVLGVLVGLILLRINVTLYWAFFSLMSEQSWCIRPVVFDELVKAPPRIVSSSYRMRTLCSRGNMPQQFVLRLFVNLECTDFEKCQLLTFESATLCSLLLVVSFGGAECALSLILSLAYLHPLAPDKIIFILQHQTK